MYIKQLIALAEKGDYDAKMVLSMRRDVLQYHHQYVGHISHCNCILSQRHIPLNVTPHLDCLFGHHLSQQAQHMPIQLGQQGLLLFSDPTGAPLAQCVLHCAAAASAGQGASDMSGVGQHGSTLWP